MLWPLQNSLADALLDDAPGLHHRHMVGDVLDDADVVGDEKVGQAELALQLFEQIEDLRLHADVQGRGRLVADDQLRLHRQRAGDGSALALAAAEFVREAQRTCAGRESCWRGSGL